jgi:hypothetical protein
MGYAICAGERVQVACPGPSRSHARRVGALPPYRTSAPCVSVERKGEMDCGKSGFPVINLLMSRVTW